jgi:hypothetical protein
MNRTLLIVLIVIGVLAVGCLGTIVVGGYWLGQNAGPPEGVTISIAAPAAVKVGEQFSVVVTATDTSGSARTLKDIDFYEALHDGISMVSVTPPMKGLSAALGSHTYTMDLPIPANNSATVTFLFKADAPGTFSGDLDVSIDSIIKTHTTPTTLVINPGP